MWLLGSEIWVPKIWQEEVHGDIERWSEEGGRRDGLKVCE